MNSSEISSILKSCSHIYKFFKGVYACDEIPVFSKNELPIAFIWNTGPRSSKGLHWVAVWIGTNNISYYFDSSGMPPQKEFLLFFHNYSTRYKCVLNSVTQDYLSNVCGQYCIYFLIMKSMNKRNKDIRKPFNTNLRCNDKHVVEWLRAHVNRCIYKGRLTS